MPPAGYGARMLTARRSRPTLAIVVAATLLGVAVGTVTAFVVGGTGGRGQSRAAPAATSTTALQEFYTVVLASIAADAPDAQANVEARARRLREAGVDAGVLASGDYGSLKQGYLVVFSGRFRTEGAAQRHLEQLRAAGLPDGPRPYVREVSDPRG
jgi:SPOR domain